MFEITIQSENKSFGELLVGIRGSLDSGSFLDFYDFLNQQESRGFSKFILNMKDLDSISSAGISVLLRIKRKLQEKDASIVLIHLQKEVNEVFHFFGFQRTFLVAKDKEAAEKLLESIYFLKKQEDPPGMILSNRFGILEEEPEKRVEIPQATSEVVAFEATESTSGLIETQDFATSPSFDELPFVEEISTEPFINSTTETFEHEFTMPLITKTTENENQVPSSIVEEQFPSNDENFQELRLNCGKCGAKMRVLAQGIHRCPTCASRFSIRQSGSISTVEKIS